MRASRRRFCTTFVSSVAAAALPEAAALGAPERGSGIDASRDSRLARQVRLRSDGIPVSRVLRELSAATGVRLDAPGRVGDERLVAFVPASSLAEIMTAVAELFRLEWLREGAERPSYRLFKPLATAREEAQLREQALQAMLATVQRLIQEPESRFPRTYLADGELKATLPDVLPLVAANQKLLLQEGYVYIPVARLAGPLRQRLTARLQPALDQHNAVAKGIQARINEERAAQGKPVISLGGADGPPPLAGRCLLLAEVRLTGTPSIWVGVRDPNSSQYTLLTTEGDDLAAAGRALYAGRELWPRPAASEAGMARGPVLDRVVELPREVEIEPTDWLTRLRQLSTAAGLPIYADLYSDFDMGMDGHPRGSFAPPPRTAPASALDGFCRSRMTGRADRREPAFWWYNGAAALVRSSRWLWAAEGTLPAALADRLAVAVQRTKHVDPRDLPELARLTGFQMLGNGFASGQLDAWTYVVRAPARLAPASRARVVAQGLEWNHLTAPEQDVLLRLLAPQGLPNAPRYTAALKARPERAPSQGGTLLQTEVEAAWGEINTSAGLQLPLPGYAKTGLPDPQALQVELN